jgi:hypothetical protein
VVVGINHREVMQLVRLGIVANRVLADVARKMQERESAGFDATAPGVTVEAGHQALASKKKRAGETAGGKPQASPTGVSGGRPLAGSNKRDGLAEAKPVRCPGVRR